MRARCITAALIVALSHIGMASAVMLVPRQGADNGAQLPAGQWPPGDLTLAERPTSNGPNLANANTAPSPGAARPLPEPGTLPLLATILAGIALGAKRKRTD